MQRARYLLLIAAFAASALLMPAHLWAKKGSPEEVVDRYTQAIVDRDFEEAAELTHPDELVKIKDFLVQMASMAAMADDDGGGMAAFALMFGDVFEDGAIDAMSPREAFVSFMSGIMGEGSMLGSMIGSLEGKVIGSVLEGDSLAHVVVRSKSEMMGIEMSSMEVTSLRKHDGEWRVMLGEELTGLTQMFQNMDAFESYDDAEYEEYQSEEYEFNEEEGSGTMESPQWEEEE